LMMSLWDALRMNMMISYQELVRTFPRNLFSRKPSHFAVVFRPQNFESYLPQDIIRLLSREHIFLINSGATISRDYGAFHIMLTFIYTVSWGFGQNE
ncbi:hypothetical protein RZO65_23160, partial [Citrobacter portucalensis]